MPPTTNPYKPFRGVLIIALAVAAVVMASKIFQPNEIIPWRTDFIAAREEARSNHKVVFAYFTAEWCAPCQAMRHSTWASKKVDEALKSYVPVKIDTDKNLDLAIRYQADPLPVIALLDNDGWVLRSYSGLIGPEDLVIWLKGESAPVGPRLDIGR